MRSPLERRIAALRGQARRQLALHGVGWLLAGTILALVLTGVVDWLFHLSRELRLITLIAFAALTTWLLWKHVIAPLVVRFRDLDLALRVEERWPGLHDRLAATVQFLQLRDQPDATEDLRGSARLREETIARTLKEVEHIDFREVIDPRPARKALATAAVPAALAVLLACVAPAATRTALTRLFLPFGGTEWPKQTHLTVHEPSNPALRIARGEPFRLEVGVAPGEMLPGAGEVTYHFENGDTQRRRLGVRDSDARLTDRLAEVEKSFTYVISAGDDVTAPRRVEVVTPPLLSHARVVLTPPAYTGEPPAILEPLAGATVAGSEFDIDGVLEGTVIEIQALTNKPVATSTLLSLGNAPWEPTAPPQSASTEKAAEPQPANKPEPPAVAVKPGGSQLVTKFTVVGTGAFGFELVDPDGFKSQPREMIRFNVSAVADTAPQVTLEDPSANRDITANAIVPLAIRAEDDFGLGKIWVSYRVAMNGSEPTERDPLVLWVPTAPESGLPPKPARNQLATYSWDLATAGLKLEPGAVVTLHGVASDLDALRGPKVGKSREVQLRVLDEAAILQQLDEARADLRNEIARTLEMERQAIRPVQEAKRTLDRTPNLPAESRDALQNAEAIQRQVSSRVADPTEGLEHKIERYLKDQDNLRIENAENKAQMQELLERAKDIREQHLNPAEESLTRATRGLDDSPNPQSQPSERQSQAQAGGNPQANTQQPNRPNEQSKAANNPDSPNAAQGPRPDPSSTTPSQPTPRQGDPKSAQPSTAQSKQANAPETKGDASKSSDSQPQSSPSNSGQSPQPNSDTSPSQSQPKAPQNPSGQPADPSQAQPRDQAASPRDELARAETEQKAIADELQKMLDELSEFETYRGMVDETKNLLKEQREVMKAAEEAADKNRTEGKSRDDLTEQQKADLENMGARQSQVGEQLRDLEAKMDELSKRLDAQDPLAASALREASTESRERNTGDKANDAGKQLAQNQMGKAREQQRGVEQDLKKLLDSLQNRRENELARLVKELKNAEREMESLRQQQARNRQQTQQAGQNPNEKERREELQRLAKEQQELEKELRRQLQRLQKLRADSAARAGQRAAQRMSKASQQQQQGEQEDADEAGKEQDQALADLEEAQEELEENRREAEEQLAMEQLSRVKDDLANLSQRQNELVGQTEDYSKKQEAEPLTLAQKKSVVGLGRAQETIRDETVDLIERLDAAPVFALIVKRASEAMDKASEQLRKGDPTPEALAAERLAAKRFEQLLDALKPDQDGMAAGNQPQGQQPGGGGAGAGGGGGDGIPTIAQLKLLKILQEELNERTESIDEIRARRKPLSPDQETELARLHDEQRNVADLARDLTQPRRDDGEE